MLSPMTIRSPSFLLNTNMIKSSLALIALLVFDLTHIHRDNPLELTAFQTFADFSQKLEFAPISLKLCSFKPKSNSKWPQDSGEEKQILQPSSKFCPLSMLFFNIVCLNSSSFALPWDTLGPANYKSVRNTKSPPSRFVERPTAAI
jgi:hypothetical protein